MYSKVSFFILNLLIYSYSLSTLSVIVWVLILFRCYLLISIRYITSNRNVAFLFAESHTTLCVFIYVLYTKGMYFDYIVHLGMYIYIFPLISVAVEPATVFFTHALSVRAGTNGLSMLQCMAVLCGINVSVAPSFCCACRASTK
jgi:hypothetical protein